MRSNESKAYLYALISVCLWSSVATGFKLGLQHMQPLQLLFAGSFISLLFYLGYTSLSKAWGEFRFVKARHAITLALMGIMNPFLYYLMLFEAYDRLPAQIAQPLNYTWAIVYALMAAFVLKQKISALAYIGMLLSYFGVLLLISGAQFTDWQQYDLSGIALALTSTVLWAGFWLLSVQLPYSAALIMTSSFLVGTPLIGLACYFTEGLPEITLTNLGYASWVGIIEMGLTFLLWQKAISLTQHSARISQLIFLSPLISLFLIQNVLGEQVRSTSITALILIISGLLLSSNKPKESQARG